MRTLKKGFLASGALAAAAAVAIAGIHTTSTSDAEVAAADAGENVALASFSAEEVDGIFIPKSEYPEGTVLDRLPFDEAVAAGMMHPPADVVFEPAVCGDLLTQAVGDLDAVSGWVQRGQKPDMRPVDSVIGTVRGGADLDQLRKAVRECDNATVTVDSAGLVGTVSLSEFEGPRIEGKDVDTFGIEQTISFEQNNEVAQLFEIAGSSAQVYVADGDMILTSCEDEIVIASQNAERMYQDLVKVTA